MKQWLKGGLIMGLAVCMSACGAFGVGEHKAMLAGKTTVGPLVIPKGVRYRQGRSYYPVRQVSTAAGKQPVSLVPPGSHIQAYKAQMKMKRRLPQPISESTLSHPGRGQQTILLRGSASRAWRTIGKALSLTPYRVLDKNPAAGSYYVLDVAATNNRVTSKTPIYRINITAVQNGALVTLTDRFNAPAKPSIARRIIGAIAQRVAS